MILGDVKKINIPLSPGCYRFFNRKGEVIYIGKAANLKSRVLSYWQKSTSHSPVKYAMLKQIVKINWIETDSEIEALLLESNLIKKNQPYYNILLRDDKRFAYLKISLDDDIPGVFITRKIDKSGKYFGPFISALAVRETLRAIRKIFPYCTMRKLQKRSCFYYHIGKCLGICGGLITKKEYLNRIIKPLVLFLGGKKKRIIKNYELQITNYERKLKKIKVDSVERFELEKNITNLRYELANMKRVLESANIISVGEKYANDVVELAKLLALPKVPERIEGYDISNIFGKEAVGSMVVFSQGEPDKNEYRKFKIRIGPAFATSSAKATEVKKASAGKQGDVQMLQQVLERRFKHPSPRTPLPFVPHGRGEINGEVKKEISLSRDLRNGGGIKGGGEWPLPDLIIVDGGKAQLNVALRVLKNYKLEIPVIAISKGQGLRSSMAPDKLFFPGQKKPLELPLASPALHLLKRVRDEAHRFAIGYHRKLRGKRIYEIKLYFSSFIKS